MLLISHRGNLTGSGGVYWENHPDYIQDALDAGYDVEIDVWYLDRKYWLGHDMPVNEVKDSFVKMKNLWCHAKNIDALVQLSGFGQINCFWHQKDDYTLTSHGYIWTYPRMPLRAKSISVFPELYPDGTDFSKGAGICSDNISQYKHLR